MRCYCAPMEGITGYVFRAAHRRHFSGVDKYFTPFLSPTQNGVFSKRELQELLPEHNKGLNVVPQLLTRQAEDFLWAAKKLGDMGYREVNLNLGCPSGTVAAKGKGSGFLSFPDALDSFLEEVFSAAPIPVSIKTRLGRTDPEEFGRLADIYRRYPIAELTIHPRVQKDFYRHPARIEVFARALPRCAAPVCYNGDLVTVADMAAFSRRFPAVEAVMVGRGLMGDPALLQKAGGGPAAVRETLAAFHDDLYESYAAAFGSRRNAMLRMKELWFYLIGLFEDPGDRLKRLRKAADTGEYESVSAGILWGLPLRADAAPVWRGEAGR